MNARSAGGGVGAEQGMPSGKARERLERLVGAVDAARGPLGEAVGVAGDAFQARVVVATTAALEVFEAAGRFLEAVASERREPPTRCRVTCPECGAHSTTEWTDVLPPGGLSPVPCAACGYMILSESEGDPEPIAAGG